MKLWYQQPAVNQLPDRCRDAISLVAHHDDTLIAQLLRVDILSVEQRAVDRYLCLTDQFL